MREELLSLLAQFISFRSIAGNQAAKQECLDWIFTAFLSSTSLQVHRGVVKECPYLLLNHPEPALQWFAHADVVPALDSQFTMTVAGDRAVGRGVKDMKGATLAFLIAYRDFVHAHGVPPVSILITTDEEIGGATIATLFERGLLSRTLPGAATPDCGGAHPLVTEQKGAACVHLSYKSAGGHGSAPWMAQNPVFLLSDAIQALRAQYPMGTAEEWRMTVTPTQLWGSSAQNQIPGTATCALDIRFPGMLHATPLDAMHAIEPFLPAGFHLSLVEKAIPVSIDPDHPLVMLFQSVIGDIEGVPVEPAREHGASDARNFTAHGVPAFLYGPLGGGLHAEDEWVSVGSLEKQVQINRRVLGELGR